MNIFYRIVLFTQSNPLDVTTRTVISEENKPSTDFLEYEETPMVTMKCLPQEQVPANKAVKGMLLALRSKHLNSLMVRVLKEAFCQKKDSLNDMIRKALHFVWSAQFATEVGEVVRQSGAVVNRETISSVIRNEVSFRQIDYIIVFGINEMLPLEQLDDFLLDTLREMLVSGHLDDIVAGVKLLHQSQQQQDTWMVAEDESRRVEEVLLDALTELLGSGELDDILVPAVLDALQTGNFDAVISNTIVQLEKEVRLTHWFTLFIVNDEWYATKLAKLCEIACNSDDRRDVRYLWRKFVLITISITNWEDTDGCYNNRTI